MEMKSGQKCLSIYLSVPGDNIGGDRFGVLEQMNRSEGGEVFLVFGTARDLLLVYSRIYDVLEERERDRDRDFA